MSTSPRMRSRSPPTTSTETSSPSKTPNASASYQFMPTPATNLLAMSALKPCPNSPNCVSTQADPGDSKHHMAPLTLNTDPTAALDEIAVAVTKAGGEVTGRDDSSLDSVFTSGLFRFKDDVRFEVDTATAKVHFRSASRTGHSDLGANRKRMAALSAALSSLI